MKKYFILCVIAAFFISSCTVYRSIRYWTPGIDEYSAFPQAKVASGTDKFRFHTRKNTPNIWSNKLTLKSGESLTVDEFLSKTHTTAFLIIRNDTILFERYYRGYDRSKISTFFSVSKSITALLTGVAVDEGYIKSVHDPVTDYIPELAGCDPHFRRLTIEHLLNMRAGFRFDELYASPFKDMAKLFYGRNQLGFIKKLKFVNEPGEVYSYNSVTTAVLGIVLERATGKPYAEYLEEKVWKPLGMEYDASVSLDDRKHRSAKSYQGLSATAIDLAKIGRLYMNGGEWDGKRIVSKEWIDKSVTPAVAGVEEWQKYRDYQYHWYSGTRNCYDKDSTGNYRFTDSIAALKFADELDVKYYTVRKYMDEKAGWYWSVCVMSPEFYAFGIMSQVLHVDPEKRYIMVRLGEKWDTGYNVTSLTKSLMRKSPVVNKMW